MHVTEITYQDNIAGDTGAPMLVPIGGIRTPNNTGDDFPLRRPRQSAIAKKVGTLARREFPFSGAFGLSRFVQAGKLLAKILNLGQIIYNDVRLSWMIGQVVLMVVFGFVK